MQLLPPQAEMERAFLASDASYNGLFFTAVRTTGVFCLPSCPAGKPQLENVEFFGTVKDALLSGYRPCKCCRPTEVLAPDWIRDLIAKINTEPARRIQESELRDLGLEPARVRRYFLGEYGMTFQTYCRARRLDSHSASRTAFATLFNAPPGEMRTSDCVRVDWIDTFIGPLIAGATAQGICLLEFTDRRILEGQFATISRHFQLPVVPGETGHLAQLRSELGEYFAGIRREFTVPLVYPGSPFEMDVWNELLRIPYGETRSYEDLARALGRPGASRAVGRANGLNRIAIVIPCHRVINKNGDLCGYGGGLWRKRILLKLECSASLTMRH